jgi:ferredoxin
VSARRGYRGFARELLKTGGLAALRLQVRTGAAHVLRGLLRRRPADPVALFLANYGADGICLPDPEARPLSLAAARCLACGLCSLECARTGGRPPLDPRDAVLSGARLEIDLVRLGLLGEPAPRSGARGEPPRGEPSREASAARVGRAAPRPGPARIAGACDACRACEAVCPAAIPIARVQARLAGQPTRLAGQGGSGYKTVLPTTRSEHET